MEVPTNFGQMKGPHCTYELLTLLSMCFAISQLNPKIENVLPKRLRQQGRRVSKCLKRVSVSWRDHYPLGLESIVLPPLCLRSRRVSYILVRNCQTLS